MCVCVSLSLSLSFQNERKVRFQKFAGLYYKFSPVFVKYIPNSTVDAWIAAADKLLDPKRLIPALIQYNKPGDTNQTMLKEQVQLYYSICVY